MSRCADCIRAEMMEPETPANPDAPHPTPHTLEPGPPAAFWRVTLRVGLALVAVAAIVAAIILLQGQSGRSASSNRGAGGATLGPLDGRTLAVGQPAPDFALRDLSGKVVRLSDERGKLVVVNF